MPLTPALSPSPAFIGFRRGKDGERGSVLLGRYPGRLSFVVCPGLFSVIPSGYFIRESPHVVSYTKNEDEDDL